MKSDQGKGKSRSGLFRGNSSRKNFEEEFHNPGDFFTSPQQYKKAISCYVSIVHSSTLCNIDGAVWLGHSSFFYMSVITNGI